MSLSKGPQIRKNSSSSKKFFTPQSARLIPQDQIQEIIDIIFKQIADDAINQIGAIFSIRLRNDNKPYSVLVTKNPLSNEIEFHAFDPNDKKNELGEGGQGKVVMAENITTGALIAVKIQEANHVVERDLERERRNLELTKRLIGIAQDDEENQYTLMTYHQGINLLHDLYDIDQTKPKESSEYFKVKKKIPPIKKFHLIILGLQALIDLHELGLAHRDIKSDNFVFAEDKRGVNLTLIDLGSAVLVAKERLRDIAGTFGYIPPELLLPLAQRKSYDFSSDVWALGIVFAEILTGENYQAQLKMKMAELAQIDDRRELTFSEIKAMMSDVLLYKIVKTDNAEKSASASATQDPNLHDTLINKALELISIMTTDDPNLRPNFDILKKIALDFQKLYARAFIELSYQEDKVLKFSTPLHKNSFYPGVSVNNGLVLESKKMTEESDTNLPSLSEKSKPELKRRNTEKLAKRKVIFTENTSGDVSKTKSVDSSVEKKDKVKKDKKLIRKKSESLLNNTNRLVEKDDAVTPKASSVAQKMEEGTKKRKRSKSTGDDGKQNLQVEKSKMTALEKEVIEKELSDLVQKLNLKSCDKETRITDKTILCLFSQMGRTASTVVGEQSFNVQIEKLQALAKGVKVTDSLTIKDEVKEVDVTCTSVLRKLQTFRG